MTDHDDAIGIAKSLLDAESRGDGESLLRELSGCTEADLREPSLSMRLRKQHDVEVVRTALEITGCRLRAAGRLEPRAPLWADREGLEQASSGGIAAYKAQRFAAAVDDRVSHVVDLCCGIGGDLIELARAMPSGVDLRGLDASPLRAAMATWNAGAPVEVATVEDWLQGAPDLSSTLCHLDPARRSGGRRVWRLDEHLPGPQVFRPLWEESLGAAIKLGPGLDPEEIERSGLPLEIEWIGIERTLSQAVVWSGALRREGAVHQDGPRRTATRIGSFSLSGEPGAPRPVIAEHGDILWEPDPALERAGLVTRFLPEDACEIAPALGLYRSTSSVEAKAFQRFRILEEIPFRERDLQKRVEAHGWRRVDVKTRGRAVDANQLSRKLSRGRSEPGTTGTAFVLRLGKRMRAYLCERL